MSLPLRWHDDVPTGQRRVCERFGAEAFAQARQVITSLPGAPLGGDWLTDHPGTGDLSSCRKVKLGPDEITPDGTNLGPALRLVHRLLPSNTDVQQVEVLCIAPSRSHRLRRRRGTPATGPPGRVDPMPVVAR